MKEPITVTGKTLEEAIENAKKQLGSDTLDGYNFKVLERNKKGFLGFGNTDAKIFVYPEGWVETPAQDKKEAESAAKPAPAPKPEKEKPAERRTNDAPKAKNNAKTVRPAAPAAKAAPAVKTAPAAKTAPENENDPSLIFVRRLLADLEINAGAEMEMTDDGKRINIEGEGAGLLIGHHGDTLDAFQYLTNLAGAHKGGKGTRITVDIENYRAKREETLRALARRMAAKALRTKRSVMLEPMTPYERRIIHSEIQGIDGVSTNSIGSENNRKIVVYLTDKKDRSTGSSSADGNMSGGSGDMSGDE